MEKDEIFLRFSIKKYFPQKWTPYQQQHSSSRSRSWISPITSNFKINPFLKEEAPGSCCDAVRPQFRNKDDSFHLLDLSNLHLLSKLEIFWTRKMSEFQMKHQFCQHHNYTAHNKLCYNFIDWCCFRASTSPCNHSNFYFFLTYPFQIWSINATYRKYSIANMCPKR